ncbi:MAG: hypothetical protein ACHQF2_09750 [Flavobacteriales bacterium]
MVPPENAKIIEWPTSTMWFDEDGILYSIPKPNAPEPQTREEGLRQMDEFRKLVGGKKTCMIALSSNSSKAPKKEDRDWIAKELESIVKAMAIVSASPLSRMIANLFFGFKPPTYPVKFFSNVEDARAWMKQYV